MFKLAAENMPNEASGKVSLLAIAWDRKVQVARLVKSELKMYGRWFLDSAAVGVTWLDDQVINLSFPLLLCTNYKILFLYFGSPVK